MMPSTTPCSKPSPDNGDKAGSGGDDSASEPHGRELVDAARVSLDRTAMAVDGKTLRRDFPWVTVRRPRRQFPTDCAAEHWLQ